MMENVMRITYEVTPLTMAVLSKKDKGGKTNTFILEEKRDYTVYTTPTKVIDEACKFFGSSLRGRLEGTKDISKITHKAPIAIDPSSGMYFFPTASPARNNCSWINHSYVDEIKPIGKNKTEITFNNGRRIILNVSYGSMRNQLQRTAQFRFHLDTRMKHLQNTMSDNNQSTEKTNQ
ncbi:MAG TPA: competence protein ComK [Pseudogracilibacillus sp.]|nr:competence protein ComK [Pseudogracilibacillus sp.]